MVKMYGKLSTKWYKMIDISATIQQTLQESNSSSKVQENLNPFLVTFNVARFKNNCEDLGHRISIP